MALVRYNDFVTLLPFFFKKKAKSKRNKETFRFVRFNRQTDRQTDNPLFVQRKKKKKE